MCPHDQYVHLSAVSCQHNIACLTLGAAKIRARALGARLPRRADKCSAAEARTERSAAKIGRLEELVHTLQREVSSKGASLASLEEQARGPGETCLPTIPPHTQTRTRPHKHTHTHTRAPFRRLYALL